MALVNAPKSVPSLVIPRLLSTVGFWLILQTTPLAVIVPLLALIRFPLISAETVVILNISSVLTEGMDIIMAINCFSSP
jgi:hypothetical protein